MRQFIPPEHLLILTLCFALLILLWDKHKKHIKSWFKDQKTKLPRRWKPKSPHDCHANVQLLRPVSRTVQPWAERKSTRGRKKSVTTRWRAYYHFARPHDSLRVKVDGKSRKRTPAMALGLTDKVWSVNDILTYPLILEQAAA